MVADQSRAELIDACRRGDRSAFQALFETHKDRVYSIAYHYSGDAGAALDIAQDVFVKLFVKLKGFRGECRFETWLTRLVINCCFDERRRRRRWVALDDERPAEGQQGEGGAQRREMHWQVRAAVAELEPELRAAVVLRYTQGFSYEEIAEALGCPAGTVASRLSRAHKELAARLGQWKGV